MHRGKSTGDADATRDRLIAGARRLLASQGYEGATIRAITREVGVNVGAVNHHFGSKENLYYEVLRDVLSPLRDRVLEVCAKKGSTRERIEGVIRAALEHLLENPDQPRFMVGVRLSEQTFPPAILEIIRPVTEALTELVEEGQAEGLIRSGPPLLFVMSLLAQPIYFTIVMGRAPRELLPMEFRSSEGRQVLLQHMMAFAFEGIGPAGPARPAGEAASPERP